MMMQAETPPAGLQAAIGGATTDFIVKSKRAKPLKQVFIGVGVTLFLLVFLSLFAFIFLQPLFTGESATMEVNGVPTTYGPGNWGPILGPGLLIGLFFLIGLIALIVTVRSIFLPGDWFAVLPEKLLQWNEKKTLYHDWDQFTGTVHVWGSDISLEQKSGKMVHRKDKPDRYVSDWIYIVGQPDAQQIAQQCMKRIDAAQADKKQAA